MRARLLQLKLGRGVYKRKANLFAFKPTRWQASAMYSQHAAAMAPQKPETFMLSTEAQQALPHDAQVALQQVDNRELQQTPRMTHLYLGADAIGD